MTEQVTATQRIRWERGQYHSTEYGHAGTQRDLFTISPVGRSGHTLRATLPGMAGKVTRNASADALKPIAEVWLAEFVASLGAVFPDGEG